MSSCRATNANAIDVAHYEDLDDVFEEVIRETGKLANKTRTSTRQIPYRNV